MNRFAIIPTHNRLDQLRDAVNSIAEQVDEVLIIDNASDPPIDVYMLDAEGDLIIHRDMEQPPNLSRLWNHGLRWVEHLAEERDITEWDVAIINDDAIVPFGWFEAVGFTMRDQGAAAGCSCDRLAPGTMFHHGKDTKPSQDSRLTGWAFMLQGEIKLRFDETFQWWCGDDDMSHYVRQYCGGLIKIGGYPVANTGANTSTVGVLLEQSAKDMQRFVDKWGVRPW